MCQRERWNVSEKSAFQLQLEFLLASGRKSLLPAALLLLALPLGCMSAGNGNRTLSWKSARSERLTAKSAVSEISADRKPGRIPQTEVTPQDSVLQLVSDEQVTSTASQNSADATPRSEDANDAANVAPAVMTISTSSVTLSQLEALALANNPTLTQSAAAISAEQGIYRQSGLYPNPQFGYLNNTATRPGVEYSNGMYYSQEIVTKNKLQLSQAAAAVEINRYSWDNESQRRRVVNDLRIRYYEALGAQEALKISEEIVKVAEEIERIAADKLARGFDAKADYLQAERHLQLVRLARDEAEDRLETAWDQMETMIGCSTLNPVPIQDELAANIPELDREAAWQELLNNSPQLRSTECDLGHAVATNNFERANAYPNVTVQVVSKYDTVMQADTMSTLVAMPIPFTNRNQGNIDKSAADIQAANAEILRVQLVLRDQLNESFRKYRRLHRLTVRFRDSILPSVEKSLEIAKRNYQSGNTAITPVLTAEHEYRQTQENYVESLTELHKVIVEIQGLQLTGGLNPAAIGSAIQNAPGGGVQRQRALLNEAQDRNSKQIMNAAQIAQ